MSALTQRVFDYVIHHKETYAGLAPSTKDIGNHCDCVPETAVKHLKHLATQGKVKVRTSGYYVQPRYIVVNGGLYQPDYKNWFTFESSALRDVYNAIRIYKFNNNGVAPTYREIADITGYTDVTASNNFKRLAGVDGVEADLSKTRFIRFPGEQWSLRKALPRKVFNVTLPPQLGGGAMKALS